MIPAGSSVADAVRLVATTLASAGSEDARLDARLLVEAATGLSREQIVLDPARKLMLPEALRLAADVQRRLGREPVSRILGERAFYGRTFHVTPDTLDPRPDTETLVELALDIAREEGWRERPIDILDIGTGTGCILLTLLAELPQACGLGIDVSAGALEVAAGNAERLGVAGRARWQHGDGVRGVANQVAGGVSSGVAGRFDLVVSNPPYIPSAEIAGLDPEVRRFDPLVALDGGSDGLAMIRAIIAHSATPHGSSGIWFVLEFGAGQAQSVVELIRLSCSPEVAGRARLAKDLGGHTRSVAWKPHI